MQTPTEAKSKLSKFADRDFRAYQEEVIQYSMDAKNTFTIFKARPGFGKSLSAMVCGVMAGDLNYLVQSKFLQTQIVGDFSEIKSIWGRNNYACARDNSRTCEDCTATKESPCNKPCPYKLAKEEALSNNYRVMNFSYYISECQYAGRFSGLPFSVVDEADSLEKTIISSVSLTFTERNLYQLGLDAGPSRKTVGGKDGLSSWKDFGNYAMERSLEISKRLLKETESIENDDEQKIKKLKEYKHFFHLYERAKLFVSNVGSDWLMSEIPRSGSRQGQLIFQPTWLSPELAREFIWKHSNKWVLMSASFPPLPVLCKQLGIDIDEVEDKQIYEVPVTFDLNRCPVHMLPVVDMTYKKMAEETPKLIKCIKEIISWHPGERGLLHTVSYDLCNKIMAGVNSPRLISHTSQDRQSVIDGFISSEDCPDDAILVSPSVERGVDLRDDLCRFIIICKCSYLSMADKVVSSRVYGSGEIGKLWYRSDAMATAEQQAGRGMRNENDYVTIYILDSQVNKLYTAQPSLWSKSFQEQVVWDSGELMIKLQKVINGDNTEDDIPDCDNCNGIRDCEGCNGVPF